MIFVLITATLVVLFLGYAIYIGVLILIGIFSIGVILGTEAYRAIECYGITKQFVVKIHGYINKKTKRVTFESISDVDLQQGFFKKLLNYGTVKIYLYSQRSIIIVKDISDPQRFIQKLEKGMARDHGRKEHD